MASGLINSAEAGMRRALTLARRGRGQVEPNPMVGCVLVRDGRILAEGYHRRFGAEHAEVDALECCRAKGNDVTGCDVFVNLEPCCHDGKTPPCVDALIRARVARVHAAMVDPDRRVQGRSFQRLREAGIEVRVGTCLSLAAQLNEAYVKRTTSGLPWVMAKWAQTLDGAIATSTGDSKWISGEASRRLVHEWRGRVDAIVVGVATVVADDPRLNARLVVPKRTARRVVVDPNVRIPTDSRLLRSLAEAPLTLAIDQARLDHPDARVGELAARGVELFGLAADEDDPITLGMRPLLQHLAQARSATNVLLEGGARLAGAFLKQRLIDQLLVFVAPKLLADPASLGPLKAWQREKISQANLLQLRSLRRVGDDVLLDYRMPNSSGE